MKKIDNIEKRDGTTIIMGNGGTLIQSGKNTTTGNITNNPAPPQAPEKKKSFQDIIANPTTIASFIIALFVIYLTFPTNIALILVIFGILIVVFLVVLKSKKG